MTNNVEVYSMGQLIYPPPIEPVYEPIGRNVNVPGEIVVSPQGELLKKAIHYRGFASDALRAYNNWVTRIVPKQIQTRSIEIRVPGESPPYRTARFTKIRWNRPSVVVSGDTIKLIPYLARKQHYTYAAELLADIEMVEKNGEVSHRLSNVLLGSVPVMLGSILCHLYGKTDSEISQMGECPNDPFSYFIIKGTEKTILIQEKLRANRFFVFNKTSKGEPICKMTSYTVKGSTAVTLSNNKSNAIRLSLHFLGKDSKGKPNTISLYQLFRLLGVNSTDEIRDMILIFVREEWRAKVAFVLVPTMTDYLSVGDDVEDISRKRQSTLFSPEDRRREILSEIRKEFFPHMNEEPEINKLHLLSLMAAKYAEFMAGLRKLDDRDHYGNKRLELGPVSMEYLFSELYDKMMDQMEDNLLKVKNEITLEDIQRYINPSIIRDESTTAFNSKSWGVKGSTKKENITDVLKRESSILAIYSAVTRINIPTSRQAKQPHLRMVHMSQLGYVDPIETPEGDSCGLVRSKSVGCVISVDSDENIVRPYLKIVSNYSNLNPEVCILNGKFLGWCNGTALKDELIKLRRSATIYSDTTIVLDEMVLYVYTDGSRPVRPLLIVENDELVITKKNLMGADFSELLREGAVEYIDAWEQDYIYIAESINDFQTRRNQIQEAIVAKEQAELDYNKLTAINTDDRNQILQVLPPNILGIEYQRIIAEDELLVNDPSQATQTMLTENLTDDQLLLWYNYTVENYKSQLSLANNVLQNLIKKGAYSHCEIDPNSLIGVSASIIPLPNHNQAPRNCFQCAMGRQALGTNHTNYHLRYDTTVKMLAWPTRPLFETQMNEVIGLNKLPAGQMVTVAIMTYTGYNQEDALIFKRSSIERGLFQMVIRRTYKSMLTRNTEVYEDFARPAEISENAADIYANVGQNGLAIVGSVVKYGDVLISKVLRNLVTGKVENIKITAGLGEFGVIEQSFINPTFGGSFVACVKLGQFRVPIIGDKFASRFAQKATIGMILDDADMPFGLDGTSPDIIINPHCIPSRMTIAKLIEIVTSKKAALKGERINATAFNNFNIDDVRKELKEFGYNENGNVTMMSGFTGQKLQAAIFSGPCYYQALRHTIRDKYQHRSEGPVKAVTHQPVGGRMKGGALKAGEMERDSFISHGAAYFLRERLFESSDYYKLPVCKTCGSIDISDVVENKYVCKQCGVNGEIGICEIPYSFKLMIHHLAGFGINLSLRLSSLKDPVETRLDQINPNRIVNETPVTQTPTTQTPSTPTKRTPPRRTPRRRGRGF